MAMSAQKNARLAWLSQEIGKGKTDMTIILDCMIAFRCSEKTVRAELKEVYMRWSDIDMENAPYHKAKFMEIGLQLLKEAREGYQFGPAAGLFKTLAQISGVFQDKVVVSEQVSQAPAPAPETVRERIAKLLKDPNVRAELAKKASSDV